MSASRLSLNASKTQEVLWLGSRHNTDRLTVREVPVLSSTVSVVGSARDLGVVIDSRLKMADHVASAHANLRSAYYNLRQIRPTLQFLSRDAAKTIVQAFISSRLEYCNSVLYGVTNNLLQRLQSVQNAAARLIKGLVAVNTSHLFCRNCTGCLSNAVWTSMAKLMFKSLHGCAPLYLSDACKSAPEASRRLRSSGSITCVIPWSRTHLGDRSFDVVGPRLWNKLSASLWSSDSLCQFRRQLKTFLFVKD